MSENERLAKQLAFALEIDKEKNIYRQTHLSGHGRNENDAEHAWHMAVMAYLLREYANEKVDISRVMLMCLIHDIVEIDAGDTYAYDIEGLATQREREDAAKERIFSILPDDQKQELMALFDEFEDNKTPESKYAHAMDNLQPLILNDSNEGGDWLEHNVCAEQIYGRQTKTRLGSKILYDYIDKVIQKHIRQGHIRPAQKDLKQINILPADLESSGKVNNQESSKVKNQENRTKAGQAMEELMQTVAKLRAPDGCPWDRAQTHESLKAACIEEAAEVVSGINILSETGKAQSLMEELGDLLLQVVMHAQIAEEQGLFTMEDVIRGIDRKMIRRHPHVFGEESLKYLPKAYLESLERPSKAFENASDRSQPEDSIKGEQEAVSTSEGLTEPHGSCNGILIDWKHIKSFEKKGKEWEEDYLFKAFNEAEELISVARKRKQDRKNP